MLPTCPACKQSVLDDDATECPFCGANMKTGKGGGAGKPAAPTKAAPKASAPSTSAGSSKPASSASKPSSSSNRKSILDDDDDPFGSADDDDPFTAATKEAAASKANAIPVSPKKTKTHVVEVKCQMCDTVGYVPEKAGGKDVKCCNPQCRAPVFTAPKNLAPPVQVVDPKAAKVKKTNSGPSKKPLILLIAGGVALVAVAGAGLWFWDELFGTPVVDAPKFVMEGGTPGTKVPPGGNDPTIVSPNPDPTHPDPNSTKVAAQLDIPNLLQLMQDNSLDEKLVNKKYCRQRTAIAFAVIGDVEGMKKQFQTLDEIESALQHFKIPAYLTLGWSQLAKGDKAGAAKTADDAVAATVNIGRGSRDTQEAVVDLVAFLIATGKSDAGKKILAENMKFDDSTPLVIATAVARHRRDYDLDHELPGSNGNPHLAWPEYGVTLILTTEGYWAEAQQWADSIPDVEAKTDCVVAWADAKLRDALAKKQPVDSAVEAAGAKLPPGGQVQLLARLAQTQAKTGNKSEAERLIAAAQETLKTITVPAIVKCEANKLKDILDWKPPEDLGLRQATIGAAALGLAQAQLKKIDEGWLTTYEALKYARGIAPSPAAVAAVKTAGEDLGLDGLRDKVRMELNLRTRDEAERKTRELKKKLDQIEILAESRFHLQEAIMINAVNAGMGKQVWLDAVSFSQRPDLNELEPYLDGKLPIQLQYRFHKDGHETEAAEVAARIEKAELPPDDAIELQKIIDAALQNNNFAEAIEQFNQHKLTGGTEEVALRGFIQAAKREGQALPTLMLTELMDTRHNQFVKLEALRMLAAFSARQDDVGKVRSAVQSKKLSSLEKISGCLGLIEGFTSRKPEPAAPPPAEETKKAAAKPAA